MIKPSKHITAEEYQDLYNEFNAHKGYMVKLTKHYPDNTTETVGYFIRAEVGRDNDMPVVALMYKENPKTGTNALRPNSRFNKAVGIAQCIEGGKRKLKRIQKGIAVERDEAPAKSFWEYINNNNPEFPGRLRLEDVDHDFCDAFEAKLEKYYGSPDNYIKLFLV